MSSKFKNVFVFSISLLFSLGIAEAVTRITVPMPKPPATPPRVFAHMPSDNIKLLYRPAPNVEVTAYGALNKINWAGFRDREFSAEKPAGFKRIIFLGDSVVYGYGLKESETLPKQLEKTFQAHRKKVEVLNLGVSGYESEQEIEFFKELGLRYDPDLVIVGYTLNDSNYGSWELDLFHELYDIKVEEKGSNLFKTTLTFLYAHSRFLYLLDQKLKIQKKVKFLRSYRSPIRRYLTERNRKVRDLPDSEYRRLEAKFVKAAAERKTSDKVMKFMMGTIGFWCNDFYLSHWNISEKAFLELKALSEKHSFQVVVVIFPIMRELDKYPLDALHHFLTGKFKEMGFEVIDLLAYTTELKEEKITPDGLHFTEFGSKLMGQYLYGRILPLLNKKYTQSVSPR